MSRSKRHFADDRFKPGEKIPKKSRLNFEPTDRQRSTAACQIRGVLRKYRGTFSCHATTQIGLAKSLLPYLKSAARLGRTPQERMSTVLSALHELEERSIIAWAQDEYGCAAILLRTTPVAAVARPEYRSGHERRRARASAGLPYRNHPAMHRPRVA